MSNDKSLNDSNAYMLHCGINSWDKSIEKGVVDYRYLTSISKTADLQIS